MGVWPKNAPLNSVWNQSKSVRTENLSQLDSANPNLLSNNCELKEESPYKVCIFKVSYLKVPGIKNV